MDRTSPSPSQVAGTLSRLASYSWLITAPVKVIFLQAIPTLARYVYTFIAYGLYYLVLLLRLALVPVLYPLKLVIWRPSMAAAMLVYQYRYLVYFASSALVLGSLFGLASFWITSSLVGSSSSNSNSKASTRTSTIAAAPPNKNNPHTFHKKAPSPVYASRAQRQKGDTMKKTNHTIYKSPVKHESKIPPILVFEEEVLVKSPLAMPDRLPSSPAFSPSKMEQDDEDVADIDMQGRDRFAEAIKALARQRKQSKI